MPFICSKGLMTIPTLANKEVDIEDWIMEKHLSTFLGTFSEVVEKSIFVA